MEHIGHDTMECDSSVLKCKGCDTINKIPPRCDKCSLVLILVVDLDMIIP
jgi:hypothetical protein